jgi:hypothetical protein
MIQITIGTKSDQHNSIQCVHTGLTVSCLVALRTFDYILIIINYYKTAHPA